MVSILKVDNITGATGSTVTIPTGQTILNSGTATGFSAPAGIIQVKFIEKLDDFSMAGSTTVSDITGLTLAITPTLATSKILAVCRVSGWGNDTTISIDRDGTPISLPATAGSRTLCHAGGSHRITTDMNSWNVMILDAPASTSALSYNVSMYGGSSTTAYCNRPDTWGTAQNDESAISTLTLMEVAVGVL